MKIPGKKREFFFFLLKIGRVLVFALAIKLVSCRLQFLCWYQFHSGSCCCFNLFDWSTAVTVPNPRQINPHTTLTSHPKPRLPHLLPIGPNQPTALCRFCATEEQSASSKIVLKTSQNSPTPDSNVSRNHPNILPRIQQSHVAVLFDLRLGTAANIPVAVL